MITDLVNAPHLYRFETLQVLVPRATERGVTKRHRIPALSCTDQVFSRLLIGTTQGTPL